MHSLSPFREPEFLPFVNRPSRYLGQEYHAVHKDPSAIHLKVALAFPDTYEIGMSHLGLKILYHILNQHPDIVAERAFAPWIDAEDLMRRRGIPLTSLESHLPLSSFDLLGFTLQYELCYSNILNMLDLAGIPPLREERDGGHPLIIAGGPCAYNPEPLADFIDLFVIGEAEEAILEIAETCLEGKRALWSREELLGRLSRYPGIYCPGVHHRDQVITKRFIADLDSAPYPTAFIVPFLDIVHDRLNIEVGRGCSQGCRFCQAGMIFRPVRERSTDCILDLSLRALRETGYEEISLFSLNATDYHGLEALLARLMPRLERERISLSLPSIRVDGLGLRLLNQIKRVRRTGLTLAPEAGSQRLRDVINKGLDEDTILQAVRAAASAGWEGMKLYFMIGLPTERDEDLLEIARLSKEASRAGAVERKSGFHLTISVSSFIPKPHTPFQWAGQVALEEMKERHHLLREHIKGKSLSLKWNLPEMSFLEAAFSRGDRALGGVLLQAQKRGCRFDGWTDQLRFDLWQAAFSHSNIDPSSYSNRDLDPQEEMPWDHISAGLDRDFLMREYQRAKTGQISQDCQSGSCQACGLGCSPGRATPDPHLSSQGPAILQDEEGLPLCKIRVRFCFRKEEGARYLSHLEILRTLARSLRRAGIPIAYSQGFHPQPRLSVAWALPVGVCGEAEWGEMELGRRIAIPGIEELINRHLPPGLSLIRAEEVPLNSSSLDQSLSRALYAISWGGITDRSWGEGDPIFFSRWAPQSFLQEKALPIRVQRKGRETEIDIRPLIQDFSIQEGSSPSTWCLTLKLGQEGSVNPRRVMARFLSNYLDEEAVDELVSQLKITRVALF